jgi:hypothetical protein
MRLSQESVAILANNHKGAHTQLNPNLFIHLQQCLPGLRQGSRRPWRRAWWSRRAMMHLHLHLHRRRRVRGMRKVVVRHDGVCARCSARVVGSLWEGRRTVAPKIVCLATRPTQFLRRAPGVQKMRAGGLLCIRMAWVDSKRGLRCRRWRCWDAGVLRGSIPTSDLAGGPQTKLANHNKTGEKRGFGDCLNQGEMG